MEIESKQFFAFDIDFSLWQSDVNVDGYALQLNIKKWTGGLLSKMLKMDRGEDREEKFLSEGFDLRETGHEENQDCAIDFNIQLRCGGTKKLEDPKVWEGSSEFRPWISQKCVNNKDSSSLLLTLQMEGITFKEVKGIWKLNVQLTIRSKFAKCLLLMKSTANGIEAGSAGEILGSEAVEKEKDGNQMSGLGAALELKPLTAQNLSSDPAEESKPLTGRLVSLDLGNEKITLPRGPGGNPGVGRKFKKMSHAEYEKCQKIGKLLLWIAANLCTLASKKEIWKLFICICFSIIVSQAEGCESGAQVVDEIKFLHPSATCNTQLENPISCKGNLSPVCLNSVPNDSFAWGCAPDICLNGNVCAEWNILLNGSYVVQGTSRNCSGCPSHYKISQLREKFPQCYKSSQEYPVTEKAPTTNNEQATSAGVIGAGVSAGCVALVLLIILGVCLWKRKCSTCQSSCFLDHQKEDGKEDEEEKSALNLTIIKDPNGTAN